MTKRYVGKDSVELTGMDDFIEAIEEMGHTRQMKKQMVKDGRPLFNSTIKNKAKSNKAKRNLGTGDGTSMKKWGTRSAPNGAVLLKSGVLRDKSAPNGGDTSGRNILNIVDNSNQKLRRHKSGKSVGVLRRQPFWTETYESSKMQIGDTMNKSIFDFFTNITTKNGGSTV